MAGGLSGPGRSREGGDDVGGVGNGAKAVEAILFAYLSARLRRLRRVVSSGLTCGVLSISFSKEGL